MWEERLDCRQARELISEPSARTAKWLLRLSRRTLSDFVGVLTGHDLLNRHASLMKLRESAMCEKCRTAEETSMHFLAECEFYSRCRFQVMGDYFLTQEEVACQSPGVLLRFINASGRLQELTKA